MKLLTTLKTKVRELVIVFLVGMFMALTWIIVGMQALALSATKRWCCLVAFLRGLSSLCPVRVSTYFSREMYVANNLVKRVYSIGIRKTAPRFFALTCDMVGDAFTQLKDIGDDFNYVFATARHISAKIREELKGVDYDQWAKLPAERMQEAEQKEKAKSKTRKLHKDFDLEDFLKFYGLEVDNVTTNDIGKCYRLTTCPIKGEKHVGQNSTTTNFILSADGGLGFHCQSTGCADYQVSQVIEQLAQEKEPYPHPIYVESSRPRQRDEQPADYRRAVVLDDSDQISPEHTVWMWPGYLPLNTLVHFAGKSAKGKSPVTLDIISRLSSRQSLAGWNHQRTRCTPFCVACR
jgi:hypothetical protein